MSWKSIADLIGGKDWGIGLLGVPLGLGSVTPGRCDLAPALIRRTLARVSTYDIESDTEIRTRLGDAGDLDVATLSPSEAFEKIRDGVDHFAEFLSLLVILGGNNAVARPAAHGLARGLSLPLDKIGVITLDAHFDMRATDKGPMNGNPIRYLLEDGLPGSNIRQIGLAPYANTRKMATDMRAAGGRYWTIADCRERGIGAIIDAALGDLAHAEAILVDFDIDVIDRAQLPGAPGARPGGMPVQMFFDAARLLAAEERVRLVDLTEFDPSLDATDLSALTAARWVAEILAGYEARAR
ncbi:arginase family protein [Sphingosinicella sp.]|uniref:arginase family protein n=1 Tax=Sphingosinicella sp. TaxID=1917971 RepID=UPI004037D2D7